MNKNNEFMCSVSDDRLFLDTKIVMQEGATVHQLAGIGEGDSFKTIRKQWLVDESNPQKCFCPVDRGIYLVRAGKKALAVLLPERVLITVLAARELLEKGSLPPPQTLRKEVQDALNTALANGESWAEAANRLGVGRSGNGFYAPPTEESTYE